MFEIKEMQRTDEYLQTYFNKCQKGETTEFHIRDDGVMCYKGRICVANNPELKEKILKEAHQSRYSVDLGNTKMYHNRVNICLTLTQMNTCRHYRFIKIS